MNKILNSYVNFANKVDDYFEYHYDSEKDKVFVTKCLEELLEDLKRKDNEYDG